MVLFLEAGGLRVEKSVIEGAGSAVGEYIYVKLGPVEVEAEYDLEDDVLYYLQVCDGGLCSTWHEGEPDRPPPRRLLKTAVRMLDEVGAFSRAARAALGALRGLARRRSSRVGTSNRAHRPRTYT